MDITWKYVEPLDKELLLKIEKYFKVKLPEDYKSALESCNKGKPDKDCFNIETGRECVLDYLIDLKDVVKTSEAIKRPDIIPIGYDPFGNVIGFKIDINGKIESLVFWDHETKSEANIAKTFTEFLKKLH